MISFPNLEAQAKTINQLGKGLLITCMTETDRVCQHHADFLLPDLRFGSFGLLRDKPDGFCDQKTGHWVTGSKLPCLSPCFGDLLRRQTNQWSHLSLILRNVFSAERQEERPYLRGLEEMIGAHPGEIPPDPTVFLKGAKLAAIKFLLLYAQ